jgi:transcriptional regulator with XRE-family HTH domain
VADAVGASKAHIWDLEAGKRSNPSLDLLRKLADNFRISVSNLIGETLVDAPLDLIRMHNDLKMLSESERELVTDVVDAMKARRRRRVPDDRST